jgi:hypothetical protein
MPSLSGVSAGSAGKRGREIKRSISASEPSHEWKGRRWKMDMTSGARVSKRWEGQLELVKEKTGEGLGPTLAQVAFFSSD